MNLKHLKHRELLSQTKQLVQNERQLLTQILHHLREVERRKLFCDLGYQSLFEYAVKELKYSEGQAGRRIQAMRLIKEIPEVENKIKDGRLSLSNISQAQSYFREAKKMGVNPELKSLETRKSEIKTKFETKDKLKILESLENKSAREGQKILIKMQPQVALPKERERVVTASHTEVRFIMTKDVKSRLEEFRSLLGPKGMSMNWTELIDYMAQISIRDLKVKKFGKKRVLTEKFERHNMTQQMSKGFRNSAKPTETTDVSTAPTSESRHIESDRKALVSDRYISKAIQYQIWKRDQGRCCKCGSQRNLNIDHVKPIALGGHSKSENLRLLCFFCNQRQAIKVFGVDQIQRKQIAAQEQLALLG